MAQKIVEIGQFSLVSYWNGAGPASVAYTRRTFDISIIPDGSIIESAILSCTKNNPYTGIKAWLLDAIDWGGSIDVTEKLQALHGVYSTIEFQYRFQANGFLSGTYGDFSSTLTHSNNKLTITYRDPASTFATNPDTAVNVDTDVVVTITPIGAYTHKVVRSIGVNSATDDLAVGDNEHTFQFPAAWIPNATSATATVKVETWNGATKLGEITKNMTVSVPNTAPYLPAISDFAAVHNRGYATGVSLPSDWPYVITKSRVRLDTTCTAGSGSAIKSVVISGDAAGNAALISGNYKLTSAFLSKVGTNTFNVTVTDNRNRTVQGGPLSITVYDYFQPSCNASTCVRCTSDGTQSNAGQYLKILPMLSFASANSKNSVTCIAKYKQMPSGEWIDAEEEGAGTNYNLTHNTPFITGNNAISATNIYQVHIIVRDELYPNVIQGDLFIDIGTSKCVMDVYKDTHVCLFGYSQEGHPGAEIGNDQPLWLHGQDSDLRYILAGSNFNADTLDGLHATGFARLTTAGFATSYTLQCAASSVYIVVVAGNPSTRTGLYIVMADSTAAYTPLAIGTAPTNITSVTTDGFNVTWNGTGSFQASAIRIK